MSADDRREYQRAYHQEYRKRKKNVLEEAARNGACQAIAEGMEESRASL